MDLGLSDSDDFCFLLLGNKSDLPGKSVEETTAREFAANNGDMLFYEVSSKTGENIQESIEAIIKQALKKFPKDDFQIPSSVVHLENRETKSKPNKFMQFFSSIFQRNNQEQTMPPNEEANIDQNIQKEKAIQEPEFEMNPANKTKELQTQLENQAKELESLKEKFESMKKEFEMQLENKDKEIADKDEELKKMQNQMEMMKREYEEEIQHLKEAANLNISDKPNDNLDS